MHSLLKSLHLFFVISWFCGLLYLPRIFVNLAEIPTAGPERERLLGMAARLLRFMHPLMFAAICFGTGLWFREGLHPHQGWLHTKLLLVLLLFVYQTICRKYIRQFDQGLNPHTSLWFRWFNEVPAFILVFIVFLAVFRPF